MSYQHEQVEAAAVSLRSTFAELADKTQILRSQQLKDLYKVIPLLPEDQRKSFGAEVNQLKQELEHLIDTGAGQSEAVEAIDITAPWAVNTPPERRPRLIAKALGSQHPLTIELEKVLDIFSRMGFTAVESRQIDDDYHMFGSLNFPEGHPARDDYDTFMTDENFIAPAHTSTMQNRVLQKYRDDLDRGKAIRAVIPGRVFRNEDLDARHEHTFLQIEGVLVDHGIHAGNLIATFKAFLDEYYGQDMEVRLQPFYFPFTEPSFEFVLSCPFCQKLGCKICSYSGWIELGGSGMIHPNVLREAGIDPAVYTGFAWGFGFERLVMMKYGIEDIRYFNAGKLEFLRQFS